MPHVVVKLAPSSSEEQKTQLAEEIVKDVMRVLGRKEEVITVALEEVDPKDWTDKVYTGYPGQVEHALQETWI